MSKTPSEQYHDMPDEAIINFNDGTIKIPSVFKHKDTEELIPVELECPHGDLPRWCSHKCAKCIITKEKFYDEMRKQVFTYFKIVTCGAVRYAKQLVII